MRSVLLIFAAIVLAGAGFFVYLWTQPAVTSGAGMAGRNATNVNGAPGPTSRPGEVPDAQQMVGRGERVWLKTYDDQTGLLAQEFRAARYDPQKDGTVHVLEPEARFYLGRQEPRQLLIVRGRRGRVIVPRESSSSAAAGANNASGASASSARPQLGAKSATTPSRGELQDVTIELFAANGDKAPALVCMMNNVSFDNDTFRIYTESFEQDGKLIASDQVPVKVRGIDYDFDGRGLDLRWNERDRRLQSLEITHGEQLVIKHPAALGKKNGGTSSPTTGQAAGFDRSSLRPLRLALASADPSSAGEAVRESNRATESAAPPASAGSAFPPGPAPAKINRDRSTPVYRATFFDRVRIYNAQEQLAAANVMHVDFLMSSTRGREGGASTTRASRSATAPRARGDARATTGQATSAATRPSHQQPADPAIASAGGDPTEPPTSQPASPGPTTSPTREQPIIVRWIGKLVVAPLDAATSAAPLAGEANVTLLGRPVVLTRQGGRVEAATVNYRTGDDSLLISSSNAVPLVRLVNATGATVTTGQIEYAGSGQTAILRGVSHAEVPLPTTRPTTAPTDPSASATTAPTSQPTMLVADWTKTCRLYFSGPSREQMTLDRADIDGDVRVRHPQLNGRSDQLQITFAPSPTPARRDAAAGGAADADAPTTQPEVQVQPRTVLATGGVDYTLSDSQGAHQRLQSQRLAISTATTKDGKLFAQSLDADGEVHARDATDRELTCGRLSMKFMPSTRPSSTQPAASADATMASGTSGELESLVASQDVRVRDNKGFEAAAETINVSTSKDGHRDVSLFGQPSATVKSGENVLVGPTLRLSPETGVATVLGRGTLHAVQQAPPDTATKPKAIDVAWAGNLVADGQQNVVNINDKVQLTNRSDDGSVNTAMSDRLKLTLAPKPATQPATNPTTKPARGVGDHDDLLGFAGAGGGDAFKDKVVETVTLLDNVQVQSVLTNPAGEVTRRLTLLAPLLQYDVQKKVMLIPAPGKMTLETQAAATTQPDAQQKSDELGSLRGVTQFQWDKELRYDEPTRRANMTGNVHVTHAGAAAAGSTTNPASPPNVASPADAFDLVADELVAELEPAAVERPSTTAPATQKAAGEEALKLRRVIASGNVRFSARQIHFDAPQIEFNPTTHELTARGKDRESALLYDDTGAARGSFDELVYNVQTGQQRFKNFRATVRR
jgi:hypothetical protein